MQKITISGGRVIDPGNQIDAETAVTIADGKILAIGAIPDGFQAEQPFHVPGHIVCPGVIDLCARLREPGQEHKASIASETAAAAKAGITTLCCPPDTDPVTDTPAIVELIKDEANRVGKCRVIPVGALTQGLKGEALSEMFALARAGCVAVSNANHAIDNTLVLRRALEYAASYDLLVMIHPEDPWLRNKGCIHEGEVSTRLGLPGIPEAAETVAVAQALALAAQTGVRLHFSQLSCAASVRLIELALQEKIAVTADVAAHQLRLTEQDVYEFNADCHVIPPLRSKQDREGLCEAVSEGLISSVCSDHQPHEQGAKFEVFPLTEAGISSLETLLPLTLELVDQGQLTLPQAVAALTANPAAVLGIDEGNLSVGSKADICIFNPDETWKVEEGQWVSRGLNSPFWQKTMKGRVTHTFLDGKIVFDATQGDPQSSQAQHDKSLKILSMSR